MLATAFCRALAVLPTPPLRRVVGLGLGLTVLSFVLLWIAVAVGLQHLAPLSSRIAAIIVNLLGALAVLGLSWLLFPAVATMIMGFYLERIAAAVEAVDYPGLPPPRHQRIRETMAVTARLMGATIALNLLALPIYLLVPGINLLVFLALNGYLLGRGYFEVVALRRLDAAAAKAMRRRFGGRIFIGGVVIAALFALPLVNLVVPVFATAFMLHVFEGLSRAGAPAVPP